MARHEKCGIYVIQQTGSDRSYIGSSKSIYSRWRAHRVCLKKGNHHSSFLQNAWNKHGEDVFSFSILEECLPEELLVIEQQYLDARKPAFNMCPLARSRRGSKFTAAQCRNMSRVQRARSAKITHCPHGHEYTPENTYQSKRSKKICRTCNKLRVSAIYAKETPEQREARRQRAASSHANNREKRLAKQRIYAAAHRSEKKEYDKQRRIAYLIKSAIPERP